MGFSNSLLVPRLIAGEFIQRGWRTIQSNRLAQWRSSLNTPDEFSYSLYDPRPADPRRAVEFYNGNFTLREETVQTNSESPFISPAASQDWQVELHTFRWMRHLTAANTDLARAHGCGLLQDWIILWGGQTNSRAWSPDTTAQRIIAWCSHAPTMLSGVHHDQQKAVIRSLVRQMRSLHQAIPLAPINTPRLEMNIALACGALCLQQKDKTVTTILRDLDKELNRQILPDGCPISRNPSDIVKLLASLVPLKQLHVDSGTSPSAGLLSSIDRLRAALGFFQHSDGSLGQFNGAGETPFSLLEALLPNSASEGETQKSAPHGGYERVASGKTVLLMDTGKPVSKSSAQRALAGTLSFELSAGKNPFIVNCGVASRNRALYMPYARATAAHSTATVSNTSSSRFAANAKIIKWLPSALLKSPNKVWSKRESLDGFEQVEALHDGYADNFNLNHRRIVQLSNDGETLNGADHFETPTAKSAPPEDTDICLRFHLPPQISASLLSNGHSILLAAPDRDAWVFTCVDAAIDLEESIRFSGPGEPRKTEQIIVRCTISGPKEIRWTLAHRKKKAASRTKKKTEAEPDLLSGLPDPVFEPEGTG